MDPQFDALARRAQAEVDRGLGFGGVEGCALAVAHEGKILFEAGFGAARADTPFLMLSITKTIFEAALLKLWSDGALHPEMRVAEIIPEFARNGKAEITIAMLQTHTCCLTSHDFTFPHSEDRAYRVAQMCAWEKDPGELGKNYSYHIGSAHWVLAEIVERV